MDGTTGIGGGTVAQVDAAWKVAEVADFDGDGKSDLLWQYADGSLAIWEMDGLAVVGSVSLYNPGANWHVA